MTKATMIKHYRTHSAADSYILGFVYRKELYVIKVKEIMPRFLSVEKASRNQGESLRLRLKNKYKEQLIKKGAVCFGSENLLKGEYNKGEEFERIITKFYGIEWEKDTVPFWISGDISLQDEEIQIKLNGASLCNTKQIAKNFYKRG